MQDLIDVEDVLITSDMLDADGDTAIDGRGDSTSWAHFLLS